MNRTTPDLKAPRGTIKLIVTSRTSTTTSPRTKSKRLETNFLQRQRDREMNSTIALAIFIFATIVVSHQGKDILIFY